MFVIHLINGREVHETKGDRLSINHDTGVITVPGSRDSRKSPRTTRRRLGKWSRTELRLAMAALLYLVFAAGLIPILI